MNLIPAQDWRFVAQDHRFEPPLRGLDLIWSGLRRRIRSLGSGPRTYMRQARMVRDLISESQTLDANELRANCRHESATIAIAAAACLTRRVMDIEVHPEQLAGALALCDQLIVEMATGEGKTLTAALAAVHLSRNGRGCHIVTVNDYLAKRDANWMSALYEACGVSVAAVAHDMGTDERRRAYAADVTCVTHKELAADFLRDRLRLRSVIPTGGGMTDLLLSSAAADVRMPRPVMRGLHAVIIDEADSVLIDDAVTPLILSTGDGDTASADAWSEAAVVADQLTPGEHYRVDDRGRRCDLTDSGRRFVHRISSEMNGAMSRVGSDRVEELITQSLVARHHFRREREYLVLDGQIQIIDESTGRLMPDRTWRAGLHQAVEVREGLRPSPPTRTEASISFQRFFNLYANLSGMTGTAREAEGEFWHTYGRLLVEVPTHAPNRRKRMPDRIFADAEARWIAVVEHIKDLHSTGRPILVGTRSIAASVELSERLTAAGIAHTILNGVQDESEAEIVARAGEPGRITVATNMAGRGTDIRLQTASRAAGGLHVVATEAHTARRVDRQLLGRAGRQGDPGSTRRFAALDDDLFLRFTPRLRRILPAGLLVAIAQRRAERASCLERRRIAERDDWLDLSLGFARRNG